MRTSRSGKQGIISRTTRAIAAALAFAMPLLSVAKEAKAEPATVSDNFSVWPSAGIPLTRSTPYENADLQPSNLVTLSYEDHGLGRTFTEFNPNNLSYVDNRWRGLKLKLNAYGPVFLVGTYNSSSGQLLSGDRDVSLSRTNTGAGLAFSTSTSPVFFGPWLFYADAAVESSRRVNQVRAVVSTAGSTETLSGASEPTVADVSWAVAITNASRKALLYAHNSTNSFEPFLLMVRVPFFPFSGDVQSSLNYTYTTSGFPARGQDDKAYRNDVQFYESYLDLVMYSNRGPLRLGLIGRIGQADYLGDHGSPSFQDSMADFNYLPFFTGGGGLILGVGPFGISGIIDTNRTFNLLVALRFYPDGGNPVEVPYTFNFARGSAYAGSTSDASTDSFMNVRASYLGRPFLGN